MKNLYLTLFLALFATCLFAQDEVELIPGAAIGSCTEPDSNLIVIYLDYNKNCSEADPNGLLAGAAEIGFHSGINEWSTIVEFDKPEALRFQSIGNGIYFLRINTMDYYGTSVNDIETLHFVARSADPNDGWDAGLRDDAGGGGFGMDEPCNDFVLTLANLPVCSEVEAESSASLLGPTTAANSCINLEDGTVTIQFDNSFNCPEADPDGQIAGAASLGFHSGANDWESIVEWDAEGAARAVNDGNDIFSVTVNVQEYYGIPIEELENIQMVMVHNEANPDDPFAVSGRDDRDGGFGGAEPCSDLVFAVSEAAACPVVIELASSDAVINVFGDVATCTDAGRGKIRISFDMSQNCPEADPDGVLNGVPSLGFHSGANDWAHVVDWNAENAVQAVDNGSGIYSLTINVQEYYGIPYDSLRNIKFVLNNGPNDPDNAWAVAGRDHRDGGDFGNESPCSDLVFDLSEASQCDLPEFLTTQELVTGLASSCVDRASGRIRLDFDRNQNCAEADSSNSLGETIVLHSGINGWASSVEWDDPTAKMPTNDGNGLYSTVIDVEEYYGVALDNISEINFLYNNGVDNPDDPWAIQGQATTGDGGFGGDASCGNFRFVLSEAPACDLSEKIGSSALAAGSCKDPESGRIRVAFDNSLNCPEADPDGVIAGTEALGFHSGANNWAVAVAWDAEGAMQAENNGSDVFSVTLDVMEYYGIPYDSLQNIQIVMNNGVANPGDAWSVAGRDSRNGGFGGEEPCSDLVFELSEVPTCDLSDRQSSAALITGLAGSCVDAATGKIQLQFDYSQNCSEADPGNLLMDLPQVGFHSGINGWAIQKPWDEEGAKPAVNDGNNVFTVVIDPVTYYGATLGEINELNFLLNNGFTEGADPWANQGQAETGMGGFGGDELCDNLLFIPSNAPACDLSTSTVDLVLTNSIQVLPNPFSHQVLIQFANPLNKEYALHITDLSGKMVRSLIGITGEQITIQRADLPAGMYFAHLRDAAGHFATTKLVVE